MFPRYQILILAVCFVGGCRTNPFEDVSYPTDVVKFGNN